MRRCINHILCFSAMVIAFSQCFIPQAFANVQVSAQGAIVINAETAEVYAEKNADKLFVPASMTKVMAMYIIFEELEKGTLQKDTIVPISKYVANLSRNPDIAAVVPLYTNQSYTVDELMKAIVIPSAGASVVAMAELISGNEDEFVTRMNSTAKSMGLTANYVDCHGNGKNQISPRSMAILTQKFIQKYPDMLNYTKMTGFNLHGKWYSSTNQLLQDYYFEGADGFKTGTTAAAGYCFTGTALRDGTRLISVVTQSGSKTQRFTDTQKLLEYGFTEIEKQNQMSSVLEKTQIAFTQMPAEIQRFVPVSAEITFENVSQKYFCTAQWYINDKPVENFSNSRFVVENGKKTTLVYVPTDKDEGESIRIGLTLTLPNGKMIKQEKELAVAQSSLTFSGYMNIPQLTIYPDSKIILPVTIKPNNAVKSIIPVQWRLDGKPIKGFTNETFVVDGIKKSNYTYQLPKDMAMGQHEISFVINPNNHLGIDQKIYTSIIQVVAE